jgi:hypothetical protein
MISLVLVIAMSCQSPQSLQSKLQELEGVTVATLAHDSVHYQEKYELLFTQPVDHNNPEAGTFQQRVILGHKDFALPMVVQLEGYGIHSEGPNELTRLLNCNQLTIEHRFFNDSRPVDSIPWQKLTIKQAAADQHHIIQQLKSLYPDKWISMGISKGGQTTMYHRRFYPNDVDISAPYVAPLNFSHREKRMYTFLNHVGTEACRQGVKDFQTLLLKRKGEIFPLFKDTAKARNYEFNMSPEKAYVANVLEFQVSFWQWGHDCASIPARDASPEELFAYWESIAPWSFLEEKGIEPVRPFFVQAMTEIGMYTYDVAPFVKYIPFTQDIDFSFTLPAGTFKYQPEVMEDIKQWLDTEGNNFLYIYGEYDPWTASAYTPTPQTNSVKMVNPGGSHTTRIHSFPAEMQDSILRVLSKWLERPIENPYKEKEGAAGPSGSAPMQVF